MLKVLVTSLLIALASLHPVTAGAGSVVAIDAPEVATIGDQVVATITQSLAYATARVECSQQGNVVYEQVVPIESPSTKTFNGTATFQLGPTATWTSGDARCTASVGFFLPDRSWNVVARDSFRANG